MYVCVCVCTCIHAYAGVLWKQPSSESANAEVQIFSSIGMGNPLLILDCALLVFPDNIWPSYNVQRVPQLWLDKTQPPLKPG